MEIVRYLDDLFTPVVANLNCSEETKAYITNVLSRYHLESIDLHSKSLFVEWGKAKLNYDFHQFQKIGDWVLWSGSVYPRSIKKNENLAYLIGQDSYNNCYYILNKKWIIYRELATNLPSIASSLNQELTKLQSNH